MSNQQYKSVPIPPNTLIGDLALPRFLKAYDLTDRWHVSELTVTISRANFEETWDMEKRDPKTRKPASKMVPVIYFKTKTGEEFPRGMCLDAATNVANLGKATGAKTMGEAISKRITIKVEHIKAFGKDQDVLRISPEPPTSGAPEPEPPEPSIVDELTDEGSYYTAEELGAEEPTPPSQGQPAATRTKVNLDTLRTLAKTQPIQAYNQLTAALGIDTPQAAAIKKEKGNFLAAFEHVAESYGSQL